MTDCHIYKLPNELLLQILAPFPTPQLLPLTLLSHRIYALILRILRNRLLAASELHAYSLLLECFHDSAKLTEPPYFCAYQGTDGLTRYGSLGKLHESDGHAQSSDLAARLRELRNMYSRFRPHRRDLENDGRRVRPRPGDIPGSRTYPGTISDGYEGETVKQTLHLEGHELFTQLIAQSSLVKISPLRGLFTSCVEVEEGVVRIWREWLKNTAAKGDVGKTEGLNDERILWVSPAKNTGLRVNVKEKKIRRDTPILMSVDEDLPVSYEVEFEEFLVRTSHLMLMFEKSMVLEDNSPGKALVFRY
ncbi:uncharacterized protein EI97DRAFT_430893 [Westerdykella ornata]|uniref:F-box domain-containing protein n=1 Tax=Westerdykella ornata TaxID=318751 RepID=A0A6A6JQT1_WESOR|nr:uncharacterized protein EI97DRAFT_430893 [Westerdykella ornata]KAF2278625.1 hypothetical protein EI97DRAFT_430893 [Westerdykella ornata]